MTPNTTATRFLDPELLARVGSLELLARAVAPAVLRHRVLLNFQAEAEKVDSDQVIKKLIETVPEPKSGL